MPVPGSVTRQPVFGLPYAQRPSGVFAPVAMTSDTTPAPWVASASGEYISYAGAWAAFNAPRGAGGNGWLNAAGAQPQWIAIKLPYPFVASCYFLYPWWSDNFPGRSPTAWTLQGSNDSGTTWMVLDTRSGVTWATNSTTLRFDVADPRPCTNYRLYISANGGDGYTGLGSFLLNGRRF